MDASRYIWHFGEVAPSTKTGREGLSLEVVTSLAFWSLCRV